ncbi:hypothetical protein N7481_008435 [Penicillium waksmanii]|uniref:uncharacterized protein n=1 Tax=Penicillium waksmanii TaxID=69791 RepID=UPI0025477AC6|nr:uncharacterized protein N7481_008435 [Penicillium waksmanii]KAJ5981137.1 hypothetical protein N7481_008435 [Penicillium waksmanii]
MQTNLQKWKSRYREKSRFLVDTQALLMSAFHPIYPLLCVSALQKSRPLPDQFLSQLNPQKRGSFLSLASKHHNKEKYDTHQYTGKEVMLNSDSCSATTYLPSSPEPVTSERADMAETMDLQSSAKSKALCIPDGYTTASSKKRKQRNESEKTSKKPCRKGKYPSVAVVIPPLRSQTTRIARSNSQSVSSDMSLSGGGERSGDSSDEDFTGDNLQPGFSDRESIEVLDCKHTRTSTAASYQFQSSRGSLLDCPNMSRDIIGRAILTIESEGPKPTFFLTLLPDNIPSPTHLSTNCNHKVEAPSRKQKQSVIKYRGSQAKGKRRRYSPNEDYLLVKLKEQKRLTWGEITAHFPDRNLSSLQVHYSTKLKHRSTGQPRLRIEKCKRK